MSDSIVPASSKTRKPDVDLITPTLGIGALETPEASGEPQSPLLLLNEAHRADLQKSGLSEAMIEQAGFRSVTAEEARQHGLACQSGMLIPYPGAEGYFRLRTDSGKPKYLSPKGSQNHLYIPPGTRSNLADHEKPLLIVEGEKKALKAVQEGFPAIGLAGVWNWKAAGVGVLPEIEQIKWKRRRTFICFDSDVLVKPEVQAALRALVQELEKRQAVVRVVLLPAPDEEHKVGLDDYLVQHGENGKREFQKLIEASLPLFETTLQLIRTGRDPAQLEHRLDDVYRAAQLYPSSRSDFAGRIRSHLVACRYTAPTKRDVEQAIKRVKPFISQRTADPLMDQASAFNVQYESVDSESGESEPGKFGIYAVENAKRTRLTDFTVRTRREIEVIEENESETRFELVLTSGQGEFQVPITAEDFAHDNRFKAALYRAAGTGLRINCDLQQLRSAVGETQTTAKPFTREQITRGMTWDEEDRFLTPGGYVHWDGYQARTGQETFPDVDCSPAEHAKCLKLKALDPARLDQVKQFIANDMIRLQPPEIMYACLATIPLALLYEKLTGFNRFSLWLVGRTGTGKSFLGRLIQSFFGDFGHHVTSWNSTANFIQNEGYYFRNAVYLVDDYKPSVVKPHEVTRLLQNYADNTGRGRLQKDATANKTRPIRGMLLSTGEDLPDSDASAIARSIVLKVPQSDPVVSLGLQCLQHAVDFPGVTADLIRYLLEQNWTGQFQDAVQQRLHMYASRLAGQPNGTRIAGNVAQLVAGFDVMAQYLSAEWNANQKIQEFEAFGHTLCDDMSVEIGEQSASQVFLRQLRSVIDSGRGVLANPNLPPEAARIIGYNLNDREVGILQEEAIRQVEESLRATGRPLGCTARRLVDLLEQDGAVVERSRQIRVQGQRPRLLVLHKSALYGKEEPSPEQVDAATKEMAARLQRARAMKASQAEVSAKQPSESIVMTAAESFDPVI